MCLLSTLIHQNYCKQRSLKTWLNLGQYRHKQLVCQTTGQNQLQEYKYIQYQCHQLVRIQYELRQKFTRNQCYVQMCYIRTLFLRKLLSHYLMFSLYSSHLILPVLNSTQKCFGRKVGLHLLRLWYQDQWCPLAKHFPRRHCCRKTWSLFVILHWSMILFSGSYGTHCPDYWATIWSY